MEQQTGDDLFLKKWNFNQLLNSGELDKPLYSFMPSVLVLINMPKEKRNLFEERGRIKEEWLYWAKQIGTGTREEQITVLKNSREAYKRLEAIEQEIREK